MKVGILGCGVIGGGVLNLIDNLPASANIEVLKVFDLPSKKEMLGARYSDSIDDICENKDIDVVIEAMGGDKFPYECIVKALKNKKSVVTSNKETVSLHIEEFYALAKENGVKFMCEASVGGGIPLICSLIESVKVDKVDRIFGIINGTTNFVLTKMAKENLSMEDALAEARRLGFAEFDATADIEGLDLTRKICILSSIAYGGYVPYGEIYHYGISKVTKEILADVKERGYILKFVAESQRTGEKSAKVSVEPCLITADNPLSAVSYEFNAVYYNCASNDLLGFYGKGAGRYPTATAMVSDVRRIADGSNKYYYENSGDFEVDNFLASSKYYVYKNGKSEIVQGIKNASEYDFVARIF
ncbi:MAG: homoserine dehydrogenase [Clostridia bacterium]|nr:homoserine dehydrogenase [Clostridia bacterium]